MLWLWQLKGDPHLVGNHRFSSSCLHASCFHHLSSQLNGCIHMPGSNDFQVNSFPLSLGDESFGRFPTSVDFFSKDLPRYKLSEASLCTSSTKSRTSWTFRQLSETNDKSIISWAMSKVKILFSSDHLWMVYQDRKAASRMAFSSFLMQSTCSIKSGNLKTISLVAWLAYADIIWWCSLPTTGNVPESINAITSCSALTTPRMAGSLRASQ